MPSSKIIKEIVASPSREEIERDLQGDQTPGVLISPPITEERRFDDKSQYADELVYQKASLVIDTTNNRVLAAIRATKETKGEALVGRLTSGTSILISNIRTKVTGIDWAERDAWSPLIHILKKSGKGGYLFGIELLNGNGILENLQSTNDDVVRPATIEETLAVLEIEKPLEYRVLKSLVGVQIF